MTKDLVRRNDGKSFYKKIYENLAAILDFRYEGHTGLHLFGQNQIPHVWQHINRGFICYSVMFCCAAVRFSDILKTCRLFGTSHNDVKAWFQTFSLRFPHETVWILCWNINALIKSSWGLIIMTKDLVRRNDGKSFYKKVKIWRPSWILGMKGT